MGTIQVKDATGATQVVAKVPDTGTAVPEADRLPVTGPLTDAQLRATPVSVSVANPTPAGLSNTELRAAPVAVSGPLTDAQLRASAINVNVVSGGGGGGGGGGDASAALQTAGNASLASIDTKTPALVGGRVPVVLPAGGSGLTDAELRASPVPVSGPVAVSHWTDDSGQFLLRRDTVTATGPVVTWTLPDGSAATPGTGLRPLSNGIARNFGNVSASTTRIVHANDDPVATSVGYWGDAPAPSDSDTASSLIAYAKRDAAKSTAANALLTTIDADTSILADRAPALVTTIPLDTSAAPPVRVVPADLWRTSFADVGSGLLSPEMTTVQTGAGQAISQASGNLLITTGTTANAETLIRSVRTFRGAHLMRYRLTLSQRIANQTFELALADLIGTGLPYTINSATSVTVTFPTTNPFSATNVGQSLNLSAITGAAGVPGRYAIASVSGLTVTFTVAGWPASGSGTLMLWGWNFHRIVYDGTVATTAQYDAARRGWANGNTAATINTTASPGHIGHLQSMGQIAGYADALAASNAAYQFTPRASRLENIPDDNTDLYLFVRVLNGATAPASTTTLTLGFLSVEMTGRQKVYLSGGDQMGAPMAPAVQVAGGSVVVTQATGSQLNASVGGPAAEDAAAAGNPLLMAGVVRTAVAPTTLIAGDVARLTITSGAAAVVKQYAPQQVEFSASLALTTTTAQAIAAAAAAGIRNHLTALWAINTGASAVDLIILDGATERARFPLPVNVPTPVTFPTGILTTAATALNANLSAAGTVRLNAYGYTSA